MGSCSSQPQQAITVPKKEHAVVWKAAHKHAVGEGLLCLIHCCTQLKDLGHPELGVTHDPASPQAPQTAWAAAAKLPIKRRFTCFF